MWIRMRFIAVREETNIRSSDVNPRCIERPGALIQGINKTQLAMMSSPGVYDYYDVQKWRNRLTLGLNVAKNTNYMKKSFKNIL